MQWPPTLRTYRFTTAPIDRSHSSKLPRKPSSQRGVQTQHALENEAKAAKRGGWGYGAAVKDWEIIADNLSKAGFSWGCVSAINSRGRTIWIVDAHRDDGKRFVVRADEKLTAFVELEREVLTVTFYLESVQSKLAHAR